MNDSGEGVLFIFQPVWIFGQVSFFGLGEDLGGGDEVFFFSSKSSSLVVASWQEGEFLSTGEGEGIPV